MRVFAAGATGALGKQLVPRLVESGHEVTGMTRSESKADQVGELGATPAIAGAIDAPPPRHFPRWLARLLAGRAVAVMMTEGRGASIAKAKRELGWRPRFPGWREGLTEATA